MWPKGPERPSVTLPFSQHSFQNGTLIGPFLEKRRRQFLGAFSAATVAWPFATHGQQSRVPVIGILNSGSAAPFAPMIAAFGQGLGEQGYVVGRNVRTEVRWANGQYERLPELANELARLPVDVLASPGGDVATVASMAATKTIP